MSSVWIKEANVCDEFVLSAYENYSVNTVAELLQPTGMLIDKSTQYIGSFEKFVFLHGNTEEVYSKDEIDFVVATGEIIIFKEFFKDTQKGMIPCRLIAVKNTKTDTLGFSIAFTKIINKACDGFNFCTVVAIDGILFSCRAYGESLTRKYYISNIITTKEKMEELYDELMYSSDYEKFMEYYSYIKECIRFKTDMVDYVSRLRSANKLPYDYINELQELELTTGLSFSGVIEKCFWGIKKNAKTYADIVDETDECLFKIESSRVNTIEILLEAEEMEKIAIETEQKNEVLLKQNKESEAESIDSDMEMKALLDDPEVIIKLLKKKRGIK